MHIIYRFHVYLVGAPKAPGGSGCSAGGRSGAPVHPAGFDLPGEVARGTADPFDISSFVPLLKWHFRTLKDHISPSVDWLSFPLFCSSFCPIFMPYLAPEVWECFPQVWTCFLLLGSLLRPILHPI